MPEPLLSARGLRKAYNGKPVLNGIDADVFPGEAIFVIGPSGGGKSTFLRCLNLLERPDAGSIAFMGQDILAPRADVNRLRKEVGMVFQHFNLKADAYPTQLSGGQKQRIAIVRALAMRPRLVLFDEPTSALDPEMVGEVLTLMKQLAEGGLTMIVVTHEIAFAREVADRILFIDQGRVSAQGAPTSLFASPPTPRLRDFLAKVL